MNFTIQQSELEKALAAMQGVAKERSTIPILANILIETIDGGVEVTGTDTDTSTIYNAAADIQTPGSLCVSARKLFDIVRNLPDEIITFESDKKDWLKISHGRSNFKIAGLQKDGFPSVERATETPIVVSSEDFLDIMRKTGFSTSKESSKFALFATKCEVRDGKMRFVTTNSNSLALAETLADGTLDVLIPQKAVSEAAKLIGEVRMGEDANHIFFVTDNQQLICRKLTGTFPNYEMILPKDNSNVVTVNGQDFLLALRRSAVMTHERNRTVTFTFKKGELQIFAISAEEGEGTEIIDAEYQGDDIEIHFDWPYIADFLAAIPKDANVDILFQDAKHVVEFRIQGNDSYRFIVNPLWTNR